MAAAPVSSADSWPRSTRRHFRRSSPVHRALILALGTALCAAPIALSGPAAAQPKAEAAYKAPRNAFGQPDLTGFWSNATLTPEQRPAALGDRAVYTSQEVAKLEGAVVKEVEEGNKPTDPNS